jgi:hypothetical protein
LDAVTSKDFDTASHSSKHDLTKSNGKADDHEAGGHHVERYPITTADFSRVETPFIIGVWILFASIAKIGELNHTQAGCTMARHIKITSIFEFKYLRNDSNKIHN